MPLARMAISLARLTLRNGLFRPSPLLDATTRAKAPGGDVAAARAP
ncbi:hypothetical protein [Bradyrhizobium sp. WD16]|nr:hypothetical protein [Bradyrhizobium sp. WD16]